jgi:hypothetical protein
MSVRLSRSSYLALQSPVVGFQTGCGRKKRKPPEGLRIWRAGRRSYFRCSMKSGSTNSKANPEMATGLGDNRYNDRLNDRSPEFYQPDVEARSKFLARFEAIDPAGLSAQDSLSRELMIRNLRQDIEGARFKPWKMPVNQMDGAHLEPLELLTLTPFNIFAALRALLLVRLLVCHGTMMPHAGC